MKKVILVLGMHRSGTSALAGSLKAMGAFLGSEFIDVQKGVNDKGFWEHKRLVTLNEALLRQLETHWYVPFALKDVDWQSPDLDEIKRQMEQFVVEAFGDCELFVLKDPRLCTLLPVWLDVLQSLSIESCAVLLNRYPCEVVRSLHKRDNLTQLISEALWLDHTLSAVANSYNIERVFVDFDDLLHKPEQVFQTINQLLDIDLELQDKKWTQFLDGSLRHHKNRAFDSVFPATKAIFNGLSTASLSGDPVNLAEFHEQILSKLEELKLILQEEVELFADYNQLVINAQQANDALTVLGAEHRKAIETIEERDQQLVELNCEYVDLGRGHRQALDIVEQRDRQLKAANHDIVKLGKQHGYAISIVEERDSMLEQLNKELGQMNDELGGLRDYVNRIENMSKMDRLKWALKGGGKSL